jgi:hypothetical protein
MSETISYRLSAPSQRAYEPSAEEVAYAQMLSQSGRVPTIGYQHAASLRGQRAQDEYSLALNEFNQRAMEAGNRAEANANLRDRMRMLGSFASNPESAFLYSLTQRELAPNAGELAANYSLGGLDLLRSRATENYAQAANVGSGGGGNAVTPEQRQARDDERTLTNAERFAQREGEAAARTAANGLGIRMIPGTDIPAGRGPLTPDERAQIDAARSAAMARSRTDFLTRVNPRLLAPRGGNTQPPQAQAQSQQQVATQDEDAARPAESAAAQQQQTVAQAAQSVVPNYSTQTHKLVPGPNNTISIVERATNRQVGSIPR